jgi:hypothetical protein
MVYEIQKLTLVRNKKGLNMSVYKRLHLLKSLYKFTIILLLAVSWLTYTIGYQRGAAKITAQCETICID